MILTKIQNNWIFLIAFCLCLYYYMSELMFNCTYHKQWPLNVELTSYIFFKQSFQCSFFFFSLDSWWKITLYENVFALSCHISHLSIYICFISAIPFLRFCAFQIIFRNPFFMVCFLFTVYIELVHFQKLCAQIYVE